MLLQKQYQTKYWKNAYWTESGKSNMKFKGDKKNILVIKNIRKKLGFDKILWKLKVGGV